MSDTKKLNNITRAQVAKLGVQALADKPNSTSRYGEGGLSSDQLKLWFDKLATYLAERINELQNTLSSDDAAAYIRVSMDEFGISNLYGLIASLGSGKFAEGALKVYPSAASNELVPLQVMINSISRDISALGGKDISRLEVSFREDIQSLVITAYNADEKPLFTSNTKINAGLAGTGLTVVDGALCVTLEN